MDEKEHHNSPHDQHETDVSDLWDRLARCFNADYIESIRRKYALWTERDRRISKIAFDTHLRNTEDIRVESIAPTGIGEHFTRLSGWDECIGKVEKDWDLLENAPEYRNNNGS